MDDSLCKPDIQRTKNQIQGYCLRVQIKQAPSLCGRFLGCLFVSLFVWDFSSHLRFFNSYGDLTITSEGLQILTDARHSSTLSSEGSLACHTFHDTGHPFIMVIYEDPWHSHLLPSVWQ